MHIPRQPILEDLENHFDNVVRETNLASLHEIQLPAKEPRTSRSLWWTWLLPFRHLYFSWDHFVKRVCSYLLSTRKLLSHLGKSGVKCNRSAGHQSPKGQTYIWKAFFRYFWRRLDAFLPSFGKGLLRHLILSHNTFPLNTFLQSLHLSLYIYLHSLLILIRIVYHLSLYIYLHSLLILIRIVYHLFIIYLSPLAVNTDTHSLPSVIIYLSPLAVNTDTHSLPSVIIYLSPLAVNTDTHSLPSNTLYHWCSKFLFYWRFFPCYSQQLSCRGPDTVSLQQFYCKEILL